MKKKLLIGAGIAAGAVALVWMLTPKPQNWSALPLKGKLQWLLLRFRAGTVDGSQFE